MVIKVICPRCDTVNKDNAATCSNCGIRLAGTPMRPGAQKTEKRYLAVGTAVAIIVLMVIVLMLWSFSCICSGCHNAGQDDINQNVDGEDWAGMEATSDADVSGADAGPGFDVLEGDEEPPLEGADEPVGE